jgi:Transposase IS66 family
MPPGLLEKLHEYLEKIREEVLPKSEAGHAVAYALKNWMALTRYLKYGDLSIDNNHTGLTVRPAAQRWCSKSLCCRIERFPNGGAAEVRHVVRTGEIMVTGN